MIKPERLSPKARVVWSKLDSKTKGVIQRDYPFRRDRDEAIYKLRLRGVEIPILAEITGFSESHIPRILETVKKDRLFDIRHSLGQMRRAFQDFYEACLYYTHGDKDEWDF
ncbi:MAG: hypothetical protein JSW13_06800 [Candidatus Aerophobus sp.]|nr:MAG: hypothetical protein JSW13_06800 [Candidatus Aerophobus sp.]